MICPNLFNSLCAVNELNWTSEVLNIRSITYCLVVCLGQVSLLAFLVWGLWGGDTITPVTFLSFESRMYKLKNIILLFVTL